MFGDHRPVCGPSAPRQTAKPGQAHGRLGDVHVKTGVADPHRPGSAWRSRAATDQHEQSFATVFQRMIQDSKCARLGCGLVCSDRAQLKTKAATAAQGHAAVAVHEKLKSSHTTSTCSRQHARLKSGERWRAGAVATVEPRIASCPRCIERVLPTCMPAMYRFVLPLLCRKSKFSAQQCKRMAADHAHPSLKPPGAGELSVASSTASLFITDGEMDICRAA